MSFAKFSRSYFGSNYEKAKKNYENATEREKLKFKEKYPSADKSKFVFDADLTETEDLIRTFTRYKNEKRRTF